MLCPFPQCRVGAEPVFLDNEESALELLEHGIDKIFMKKFKERNLYYGRVLFKRVWGSAG